MLLTHLFFVDDSLLFCKANQQDCRKILDILETYRKCLPSLIGRKKKKQALTILRRECGKNYKAGKRSFCLKWLERSLLKLWFRQYHSIL